MADIANIYICKVIRVIDDKDGLRIRVRIPYFDYGIPDEQLPYAFPLLPKFLHVNPKIGEEVLIFTQNAGKPSTDRFFIGPLISQPYLMSFDNEGSRLLKGASKTSPYPRVNMKPGNNGVLPNREDIAIEGRLNTEIVLKDNEIRLRCGYKKNPSSSVVEDRLLRNDINPAYIQMKYGFMPVDEKSKPRPVGMSSFAGSGMMSAAKAQSMINIVADRINMLSHESATNFNLHDETKLISDEELLKIYNESHPVVYGDNLVRFLKKLIDLFRNHHHPFAYKTPEFSKDQNQFFSTDLNKELLSKNIFVN